MSSVMALVALALALMVWLRYGGQRSALPSGPALEADPTAPAPPPPQRALVVYGSENPPSTWQPFVHDGERLVGYSGRTAVRIVPVAPGVEEMIVDAFPEGVAPAPAKPL